MTTLRKRLQKEITCYPDYKTKLTPSKAGQYELPFTVYQDRVNFVGSSRWLREFFRRCNVIADFDRSGLSISLKDAEKFGLDLEQGYYILSGDSRKKALRV